MMNEIKSKITIMVVLPLLMFLVTINSCTVYKTPRPKPLHVLVVTTEGDTLKLPISAIRPIYNYNNITYPRSSYYPYNNMYYNYNYNYKSTPMYKKNNNNDKIIVPKSNTPPPRIERSGSDKVNAGNPAVNNPRKNN